MTTPTRDQLLATHLQDLVACWLLPRCPPPCRIVVQMPIRLLVNKHKAGNWLLRDAISKLRHTDGCGKRPASVAITDSIWDPKSYPKQAAAWRVEVFP